MFKNASDSIGKWISKYAVWVIVVVLILTGVMGYGLSQIEIRTSVNMLLSDEDPVAVNNTRFQEKFGGESLILLVQGQKSQLFDSHSLNILNDLQTKLSGVDKVYSVTSPMSLAEAFAEQANKQSEQMEQQIAGAIKEAAGQAAAKAKESGGDEAAQADAVEQAKARVMQGVQEKYGKQLSQMEAIGDLSVSNDKFVRYALLDENGLPQPTVAQLLPEDGNNMLFQIQLDSGLTMQEMATATDEIEQIIADHKITETKTLFSGIPHDLQDLGRLYFKRHCDHATYCYCIDDCGTCACLSGTFSFVVVANHSGRNDLDVWIDGLHGYAFKYCYYGFVTNIDWTWYRLCAAIP